jgi:transposase
MVWRNGMTVAQPDSHLGPQLPGRAFDDEAQAADLIQAYEAWIAAVERLVGQQALELEFLKGALRSAPRPRSKPTSVVGPAACLSPKDVV